jgi:beta-N-acetylhexosaminidase
MVLMPEDISGAYQGVLSAVSAGSLTENRIDESVGRILAAKESAGLLG